MDEYFFNERRGRVSRTKTVGVVFQRLEPEFCKRKVKKEQEVQHEHDFIRRTAHEHEKQNS